MSHRPTPGLPGPNEPSLPLQPQTTATLGPFTATKFFVTATFTATFWAEIHLKAENISLHLLIVSLIGQCQEILQCFLLKRFDLGLKKRQKRFRKLFRYCEDIQSQRL